MELQIECSSFDVFNLVLGCKADRHENIGKGKIGIDCFKKIVNDERFRKVPLILETAGPFDEEINLLKSLVEGWTESDYLAWNRVVLAPLMNKKKRGCNYCITLQRFLFLKKAQMQAYNLFRIKFHPSNISFCYEHCPILTSNSSNSNTKLINCIKTHLKLILIVTNRFYYFMQFINIEFISLIFKCSQNCCSFGMNSLLLWRKKKDFNKKVWIFFVLLLNES